MSVMVWGNQKGGVGKSTLAVLFVQWLAERRGQRVAVIDLDTQGDCSRPFLAHDAGEVSVRLFSHEALKTPLAAPGGGRIALVRATSPVGDVEWADHKDVIPAFDFHVRAIAKAFDVVVIDTPPAPGVRMAAALMAADFVVTPIEMEEFSLEGVSRMLRTVFGLKSTQNPRLEFLGLVPNRLNPLSVRQTQSLAELFKTYPQYVVPGRIGTRTAIPEAISERKSLWAMKKSSAREAAAELDQVFSYLWGRMGGENPAPAVAQAAPATAQGAA